MLEKGEMFSCDGKFLVCLGSVVVNGVEFAEEKTFKTTEPRVGQALSEVILLEFLS